jgi:hypothetical protein
MAGKSCSHNGNPSKLRLIVEISQDKSFQNDPLPLPEQPCPKCNDQGYIVVRVYPWDGCSYDEKPCDLCNPKNDELDF